MTRITPPSFAFTGGNPCLDFANTVDDRTTGRPRELLTDYERLLEWGTEAGVITGKTTEHLRHLASDAPGTARTALRHATELRDAIYDVFSAVAHRRTIPGPALEALNESVRRAAPHAQIVHANRRFTSEWIHPERNLDAMLWPVSRAAATLLMGDDIGRVRQCASESCSWLFLDQSKNSSRRWCDMNGCGNRDKARRYYERQRAG
ncbi:MAG TPA: ABATE domain-containing protein [Gemmatimonadales bacterium]|nr:ABATE domain-containing protein [Gemmatimonadales bacterium]